ncbi:MAG: hypothetical protein R6U85_00680 [Salinivirgaceae bacterium]
MSDPPIVNSEDIILPVVPVTPKPNWQLVNAGFASVNFAAGELMRHGFELFDYTINENGNVDLMSVFDIKNPDIPTYLQFEQASSVFGPDNIMGQDVFKLDVAGSAFPANENMLDNLAYHQKDKLFFTMGYLDEGAKIDYKWMYTFKPPDANRWSVFISY